MSGFFVAEEEGLTALIPLSNHSIFVNYTTIFFKMVYRVSKFLFSSHIIPLVLFFCSTISNGQTRLYFSLGSSLSTDYENNTFYFQGIGNAVWSTDGSYTSNGLGKDLTFDVVIEKKLGRITGISGVRLFNSGYSNHWSQHYSSLRSQHIGIPILIRLNMDNWLLADLGLIVVSTVGARLNETAFRGSGNAIHAEGNIARHFDPFGIGFNEQLTLAFWRYTISFYFILVKQSVDEDFSQNWKINGSNSNGSLFTRDFVPDFRISLMGLKLGIRLR